MLSWNQNMYVNKDRIILVAEGAIFKSKLLLWSIITKVLHERITFKDNISLVRLEFQ